MIALGNVDSTIDHLLQFDAEWKAHPALRDECGDRDPSVALLKQAFARGVTFIRPKACSTTLAALGASR